MQPSANDAPMKLNGKDASGGGSCRFFGKISVLYLLTSSANLSVWDVSAKISP